MSPAPGGRRVYGTHAVQEVLRARSKEVQAVFLAEGILEEQIAEGSYIDSTDNGAFSANYPRHSWEITIEETRQLGLYTIEAVVKWEEKGKEKQYTLTTLAAERF